VELKIEVSDEGKTENITVEKSLDKGLDQQAVDAFSQWRFRPGEKNGKPVRVAATLEVNFRLMDK
jgi:periplasmic protein TonB